MNISKVKCFIFGHENKLILRDRDNEYYPGAPIPYDYCVRCGNEKRRRLEFYKLDEDEFLKYFGETFMLLAWLNFFIKSNGFEDKLSKPLENSERLCKWMLNTTQIIRGED